MVAALERLENGCFSVVNTLVPTFLIKSSSFFHVTRTAMRYRMSSKVGKIRPWTAELAALERLKKSPMGKML